MIEEKLKMLNQDNSKRVLSPRNTFFEIQDVEENWYF